MPRVCFTQNLKRHVGCPDEAVPGATVREALDSYFARHPGVRGYVLDEHGAVRQHVVVFAGDTPVRDRDKLLEPVSDTTEIWVMQALSGGC